MGKRSTSKPLSQDFEIGERIGKLTQAVKLNTLQLKSLTKILNKYIQNHQGYHDRETKFQRKLILAVAGVTVLSVGLLPKEFLLSIISFMKNLF